MNALVVADDLTGAMDTGHGFAARGRGVQVCLSETGTDDPDAADVLTVDTDSRDATPDAAAAAVESAVDAHPAPLVYKKVDSTLRGNVVPEVDAAVAATGAALAVVAPAFPAAGRTTVDGEHRVDGTPLAEAGYGADGSDLPARFAASRYPVVHVGRAAVEDGPAAVRAALEAAVAGRDRPVLATCDAASEAHLHAVAAGAALLDAETLSVGSGGLAAQVSVPGSTEPVSVAADAADRPGVLGVVGSVNERTLAQLAAVPDDRVVALDPVAAVRDPETAGRDAAAALGDRIDRDGRAVVTAATDPADVERAEAAARATGDGVDAPPRVAAALATAAERTVETATPGGLVLTGGAVGRATLSALGARELALTGTAVDDGVPMGVVAGGPAAGVRVATKAGGFGSERTILNCLDAVGL